MNNKTLPYIYMSPAIILIILIYIAPLIYSIFISFTDWDGLSKNFNFVGLKNFIDFFSLSSRQVIVPFKNTFIFTLITVTIQNIIALFFAVLLNEKFRGRTFFRTVFFMPTIITTVAVGYIWRLVYDPIKGPIAFIGKKLGIDFLTNIRWLSNGKIALYSVILVNIWQWFGWNMVIFLAGLQTIPRDLYEAADIDGGSVIGKFMRITLPLLVPSITINVILSSIGGLRVYDLPYIMTQGGPGYATETVVMTITRISFYLGKYGLGAAITILLFIITLCIAIFQNVFFNRLEKRVGL